MLSCRSHDGAHLTLLRCCQAAHVLHPFRSAEARTTGRLLQLLTAVTAHTHRQLVRSREVGEDAAASSVNDRRDWVGSAGRSQGAISA